MKEKIDKIKIYVYESERYPDLKIRKKLKYEDVDIEIEVSKAELIRIKWIIKQYQKVQYFLDEKIEEFEEKRYKKLMEGSQNHE